MKRKWLQSKYVNNNVYQCLGYRPVSPACMHKIMYACGMFSEWCSKYIHAVYTRCRRIQDFIIKAILYLVKLLRYGSGTQKKPTTPETIFDSWLFSHWTHAFPYLYLCESNSSEIFRECVCMTLKAKFYSFESISSRGNTKTCLHFFYFGKSLIYTNMYNTLTSVVYNGVLSIEWL